MSYNLGKYKIQPGDRVAIKSSRIGYSRHSVDGVLVAEWDFARGNTGVVIEVTKFGHSGNSPPWIIVEPDKELGYGHFTFAIKEVRRIER